MFLLWIEYHFLLLLLTRRKKDKTELQRWRTNLQTRSPLVTSSCLILMDKQQKKRQIYSYSSRALGKNYWQKTTELNICNGVLLSKGCSPRRGMPFFCSRKKSTNRTTNDRNGIVWIFSVQTWPTIFTLSAEVHLFGPPLFMCPLGGAHNLCTYENRLVILYCMPLLAHGIFLKARLSQLVWLVYRLVGGNPLEFPADPSNRNQNPCQSCVCFCKIV